MAAPRISVEWAICSWFAMKAPDERPETDTCAGSTGYAPSRSAAEAEAQSSAKGSAFKSWIMARTPKPTRLAIVRPRSRFVNRASGLVARQPESLWPARPCLLQRGADLVEHGADLGADQRDGGNDEHRNQARDQRVFDRSHSRFIANKVTNSKHGILLMLCGTQASARI